MNRVYSFLVEAFRTDDMDAAIVALAQWLNGRFGANHYRMHAKVAGPCVLDVVVVGHDVGPLEWPGVPDQIPAEEG